MTALGWLYAKLLARMERDESAHPVRKVLFIIGRLVLVGFGLFVAYLRFTKT